MALFRNWRLTQQNSYLVLKFLHLSSNSLKPPVIRETGALSPSNWCAPPARRAVHCSPAFRGLEEFFPQGDPIEEGERSGRRWEARELRQKSNEDLHKLWYVLLKERNMLMTVKHEAWRKGFIMPAPERLKKVRKSMGGIKLVLGERERTIAEAKEMMKKGRREEQQDQSLSTDLPSDAHSVAQ